MNAVSERLKASDRSAVYSSSTIFLIGLCFVLSGATGLIYEVLWARMLGLVFGATTLAVSTVLAAFMGGLALGSALAGKLARRIKKPLSTYGLMEIGIAIYALLVPFLFRWIDDLYALIQRLHHEVFKNSPAPGRLDARYVTEDVPFGLVPLSELGRLAGVATPIALGLSQVASAALGRDFFREGRTLERMGLEGRSLDAILSAVTRTRWR